MKNIVFFFIILLFGSTLQAQWLHQDSGVNVGLSDVYCITEDIVVVIGGMGTILKTTDGGENWIQKTSNTTEHLNKLDFANSTTGYIVGENGTLLKTLNSGETWAVVDVDETVELYAVSCVNENIIYISGENGLIKKTEDGGTTWTIQDSEITVPIYNIQFVSETVGYCTAGGNSDLTYFLKTVDSGITWTIENLGGGPTYSLFFYNELIGYRAIVEFYKTNDGGNNWENVWGNYTLSFSIDATSPDMVWTAGFNYLDYWGYIYKGDLNLPQEDVWTSVFKLLERYMSIDFATETTGYVVGYNYNNSTGLIKKNSTGLNILNNDDFVTNENIKVFPNPTSDTLYIIWDNKLYGETNITLFNSLGKTVYTTQTNKNYLRIDVSNLKSGVYFISIIDTQCQKIQKIIIQ